VIAAPGSSLRPDTQAVGILLVDDASGRPFRQVVAIP
jgi:hypothetical protein